MLRVRALPSLGIRPSIKIPIDLYRDASSETGTSGSLSVLVALALCERSREGLHAVYAHSFFLSAKYKYKMNNL